MEELNEEITGLFLRLWDGYEQRHIELDGTNRSKEDSGKVKVKTVTVEGPLTPELAWAHLNGKASVGVAPVKADSTCRFGVLDIDWYDMPEDEVHIHSVLCGGDRDLAHWLTMWLADACQRPTEPSPPTCNVPYGHPDAVDRGERAHRQSADVHRQRHGVGGTPFFDSMTISNAFVARPQLELGNIYAGV